jgi:signal transduction histidine kinase
MSPKTLARATDPYFTTRKGKGGTGLGLAGVKAFAEDAGGALKLVSAEGRGATATIYLPIA